MSTVAAVVAPVAAAPAAPVKAVKAKKAAKPKGEKKAKVPAAHPTYSEMVKAAVVALNEKKGSSRAAILKYIAQTYKVGDNVAKVGHVNYIHLG